MDQEAVTKVSIKGYEILDASAQLIKARHTNLDRVVALRVLNARVAPELTDEEQQEIDRFLQVARTVCKIHHPNIIGVSDAGTCPDSGQHYMALEYVGDQTLAVILEEETGGIGESDALAVTQAVAEALICLEEHSIAHGDVRPQNVLIDNDGTPKLSELGFGLQKPKDATVDRYHYMAPEVFAGQTPDLQSDLYSLGCTLYRLVTGRTPYSGNSREELADAHSGGSFPDAREHGASDPVADALRGFVALDPNERYSGALNANLDLVRVMTGHPPDGPSGAGSARGENTKTFKPIRLEEGSESVPVEETKGPPFTVRLSSRNVVLEEYEFDKDLVTIGRGESSDIHIDNPIVSRRHATLVRKHGGIQIKALSSTNATAVDGEQLKGPKALRPGGLVVISDKFHLEIHWKDPASDPHSPYARAAADDDTPVAGTRTIPKEEKAPPRLEPEIDDAPTPVVGTKRPTASEPEAPYAATPEPSPYATEPAEASPYAAPAGDPISELAGVSAYGEVGGDYIDPVTEPVVRRAPPQSSANEREFSESGLRKIFAPPQGYLVFARTGRQVRSFVDKGFQAGSSSACDLRLPKGAPRKAMLIVRGVDAYRLYNVAPSIDMVALNDEPVPDRAVLEDGDMITVCGIMLLFSLENE